MKTAVKILSWGLMRGSYVSSASQFVDMFEQRLIRPCIWRNLVKSRPPGLESSIPPEYSRFGGLVTRQSVKYIVQTSARILAMRLAHATTAAQILVPQQCTQVNFDIAAIALKVKRSLNVARSTDVRGACCNQIHSCFLNASLSARGFNLTVHVAQPPPKYG